MSTAGQPWRSFLCDLWWFRSHQTVSFFPSHLIRLSLFPSLSLEIFRFSVMTSESSLLPFPATYGCRWESPNELFSSLYTKLMILISPRFSGLSYELQATYIPLWLSKLKLWNERLTMQPTPCPILYLCLEIFDGCIGRHEVHVYRLREMSGNQSVLVYH